jgi:dihydrolipoamide dehydrogenase
MESAEYDLIVIGAGPVGENVADRAVQGGLSVVIVESELVGGECSTGRACRPRRCCAGAAPRRAAVPPAPGRAVGAWTSRRRSPARRDRA